MVSRLRGRAVQTNAPMTRKSWGVLFLPLNSLPASEDCSDLSTGLLILQRWIDIASFANPSAVWVMPTVDVGNDALLAW
jgi:hypothetical protein